MGPLPPAEVERIALLIADSVVEKMLTRQQPRLVDRHTLAGAIGLSVATIDRRTKDGTIVPIRVGNRVLFDVVEVVAQLKEGDG